MRTLAVLGEEAHHAREAFHWGNLCGSLALGLPQGTSACVAPGRDLTSAFKIAALLESKMQSQSIPRTAIVIEPVGRCRFKLSWHAEALSNLSAIDVAAYIRQHTMLAQCQANSETAKHQGFLCPNRVELLWILVTALSMQVAQLALTRVLQNPMVSAAKYFFLTVVLNLGFGILMGDPWPSLREWLGAAVVVLSMIFSEVPAKQNS